VNQLTKSHEASLKLVAKHTRRMHDLEDQNEFDLMTDPNADQAQAQAETKLEALQNSELSLAKKLSSANDDARNLATRLSMQQQKRVLSQKAVLLFRRYQSKYLKHMAFMKKKFKEQTLNAAEAAAKKRYKKYLADAKKKRDAEFQSREASLELDNAKLSKQKAKHDHSWKLHLKERASWKAKKEKTSKSLLKAKAEQKAQLVKTAESASKVQVAAKAGQEKKVKADAKALHEQQRRQQVQQAKKKADRAARRKQKKAERVAQRASRVAQRATKRAALRAQRKLRRTARRAERRKQRILRRAELQQHRALEKAAQLGEEHAAVKKQAEAMFKRYVKQFRAEEAEREEESSTAEDLGESASVSTPSRRSHSSDQVEAALDKISVSAPQDGAANSGTLESLLDKVQASVNAKPKKKAPKPFGLDAM